MAEQFRQQFLFSPAGVAVVPTGDPGPACLACGGATVISPGVGPHHQRIDCADPRCGAWRWAPKPRPAGRGGVS